MVDQWILDADDTMISVFLWISIAGIHYGVSKCFEPCFGTDLNMKASMGKHWWKLSPVVHFIIYLHFITTTSDEIYLLFPVTKQEYANLIAIPIGFVLYLCSKLAPRWASPDGRISFAAPVVFHSINWFVVWIDFFTVNQFEWPGFTVCIWMFLFWAELTSCLHSIDCTGVNIEPIRAQCSVKCLKQQIPLSSLLNSITGC